MIFLTIHLRLIWKKQKALFITSQTDTTSLKIEANNSDIDKLENAPVDLSKLSIVIDNHAVKKTVNDKFVIKVGWSRRLIVTQMLKRFKTRYLVLLI